MYLTKTIWDGNSVYAHCSNKVLTRLDLLELALFGTGRAVVFASQAVHHRDH
jgi:hypothetical protein